jgi:BolA protein
LTNRQTRIFDTLNSLFSPESLLVEDDSARHAGHAGAHPNGETHYTITIQSQIFVGLSRIEIHRKINDALASEFESGLHALSIKVTKPDSTS